MKQLALRRAGISCGTICIKVISLLLFFFLQKISRAAIKLQHSLLTFGSHCMKQKHLMP